MEKEKRIFFYVRVCYLDIRLHYNRLCSSNCCFAEQNAGQFRKRFPMVQSIFIPPVSLFFQQTFSCFVFLHSQRNLPKNFVLWFSIIHVYVLNGKANEKKINRYSKKGGHVHSFNVWIDPSNTWQNLERDVRYCSTALGFNL